ncbi:hypothetical protein SK128_027100, partial [Halocaridina rubra]
IHERMSSVHYSPKHSSESVGPPELDSTPGQPFVDELSSGLVSEEQRRGHASIRQRSLEWPRL